LFLIYYIIEFRYDVEVLTFRGHFPSSALACRLSLIRSLAESSRSISFTVSEDLRRKGGRWGQMRIRRKSRKEMNVTKRKRWRSQGCWQEDEEK
jgi:hypothetical protein